MSMDAKNSTKEDEAVGKRKWSSSIKLTTVR